MSFHCSRRKVHSRFALTMHITLITCLVVITAKAQPISFNCAELCESLVYRESSVSWPADCVCSTEESSLPSSAPGDSGIYFEPAEIYTLRRLSNIQPKFFILNPSFKIKLSKSNSKSVSKRRLSQKQPDQDKSILKPVKIKQSNDKSTKKRYANNRRALYLDIDIDDPAKIQRSSQNKITTEQLQSAEKNFEQCMNLHTLAYEKTNSSIQLLKNHGEIAEANLAVYKIIDEIKNKCRESSDIVEQSLKEIIDARPISKNINKQTKSVTSDRIPLMSNEKIQEAGPSYKKSYNFDSGDQLIEKIPVKNNTEDFFQNADKSDSSIENISNYNTKLQTRTNSQTKSNKPRILASFSESLEYRDENYTNDYLFSSSENRYETTDSYSSQFDESGTDGRERTYMTETNTLEDLENELKNVLKIYKDKFVDNLYHQNSTKKFEDIQQIENNASLRIPIAQPKVENHKLFSPKIEKKLENFENIYQQVENYSTESSLENTHSTTESSFIRIPYDHTINWNSSHSESEVIPRITLQINTTLSTFKADENAITVKYNSFQNSTEQTLLPEKATPIIILYTAQTPSDNLNNEQEDSTIDERHKTIDQVNIWNDLNDVKDFTQESILNKTITTRSTFSNNIDRYKNEFSDTVEPLYSDVVTIVPFMSTSIYNNLGLQSTDKLSTNVLSHSVVFQTTTPANIYESNNIGETTLQHSSGGLHIKNNKEDNNKSSYEKISEEDITTVNMNNEKEEEKGVPTHYTKSSEKEINTVTSKAKKLQEESRGSYSDSQEDTTSLSSHTDRTLSKLVVQEEEGNTPTNYYDFTLKDTSYTSDSSKSQRTLYTNLIPDTEHEHGSVSDITTDVTTQPIARHDGTESSLMIPKVLTREFPNDTVMSEVNGTEMLPNNDFVNYTTISTEQSDDVIVNDKERTLFMDEKNSRETFINRNGSYIEPISGNLYFVFDKVNIPARFVQENNGNISVGIDGLQLCGKLNSHNSSLITLICNHLKHSKKYN